MQQSRDRGGGRAFAGSEVRPAWSNGLFRGLGVLIMLGGVLIVAREDVSRGLSGPAMLGGAAFLQGAVFWAFGDWLRNVDERLRSLQLVAIEAAGSAAREPDPETSASRHS